jgi:hypothetical protein
MSVINKMLQELERRQSGAVSQGHISGAVRISAAAAPTRVLRRVAIGLMFVAVVVAVGYSAVWMKKQAPAVAAAPAVPSVATPVAAVPAPGAVAPASAVPAAPVVAAVSAPMQSAAAPSAAPARSATPAPT